MCARQKQKQNPMIKIYCNIYEMNKQTAKDENKSSITTTFMRKHTKIFMKEKRREHTHTSNIQCT